MNQEDEIFKLLKQAVNCHQLGNTSEARDLYHQVLNLNPSEPNSLKFLALIEKDNQQTKAVHLLNEYIKIVPNDSEAFQLLGEIYLGLYQYQNSEIYFRKSLDLDPGNYKIMAKFGKSLWYQGKFKECIAVFEKSNAIMPDPEVLFFIASSYQALEQYNQALKYFNKSLEINPDNASAYFGAGNILFKHKKLSDSINAYENALKRQNNPKFFYNLGIALTFQGRIEEAIKIFSDCLKIENSVAAATNRLFCMQYSDKLTPEKWENSLKEFNNLFQSQNKPDFSNEFKPEKKIKIAFLSPDFRTHSCYWFIKPLLESIDQDSFEIYCYSNLEKADEKTEEIKSLSNYWRDIFHLDDNQVINNLREDQIDILIDLAGLTAGNRAAIFASGTAAPVQVTWLGFPSSTGLKEIEYRISDQCLSPDDTNEYFSEKIWNLKRPSHCYKPPEKVPAIAEAPYIKNNYISFGTFNNLSKLSETSIALWAELLRRNPGSILIIKSAYLNDRHTGIRLTDIFKKYGIQPTRIELNDVTHDLNRHLEYYNRIDIALDSYPYNGATTTMEALLMGVPVITLYGERSASRYGKAFLEAIGYHELVASGPEEFLEIAEKLIKSPDNLNKIRKELRSKFLKSSLCDQSDFAQEFSNALRNMWQIECKKYTGQTDYQ